ncbi:hypothetical protein [Arsenicibacter rosenii]|uniref:Uncharacterized protein n=1 Tax=Arsenicibacter rosenii TaxID=1750698 RepID=A0A1S2VE77_9BACT|nr:hypothetical protein [Arsenicibacter rosenii]OIN56496.1 hypothetical protein BLX24_24580 [Arsenicibacter rosenii]
MTGILTKVLTRTIVKPFYEQNAGLLAVVFLIAGSFLRAIEHITLAEVAIRTHFVLAIYIGIWAIYGFHTTRFAARVLHDEPFLHHLRLIPVPTQWLVLVLTQLQLLLPVLVYAGFVATMAINAGIWLSLTVILLAIAALATWPLIWYTRILRNPATERFSGKLGSWFSQRFTTPYLFFFLRYLLSRQPVLLLLTKTGTLLVLLGLAALYPTDDYDLRLFGLGGLLAALAHITIVYRLYQFEHESLVLYRNLPVSILRRLLRYMIQIAVLLLPEAILLVRYRPHDQSLTAMLSIWAFALSLTLLEFSLLFKRHRLPDELFPALFWLLIGGFFAIMYQLPVWLLAGSGWLTASILFIRYYPQSVWETR